MNDERESPPPTPPMRRLGDAWVGWDARRDGLAIEYHDGPALYLAFATLLAIVASAGIWFLLWLAQPRLSGLGVSVAGSHAIGVGATLALFLPGLGLWSVAAGLRAPVWLRRPLQRAALMPYPILASMTRALGLSRDRLGHAFLELTNRLALPKRHDARHGLLVLAPRCLRPDLLHDLRGIAAAAGVEFVVVGGGEQARAVITEIDPGGVLAIACERDLVAGVLEIAGGRPVLTLANRRPEGPCRNSEIDLDEAQRRLEELSALVERPGSA
jgi:hypothetical protein